VSDKSKFPIEDLERAIGRLCIAWAHLEDDFFSLLNYLMGHVDVSAFEILRNELDLRDALEISKNIALHYQADVTSPHIVRLSDYVNNTIRPERNRIVHDPIYGFGGGFLERVTYTSKLRKQPKPARLEITHYTKIWPGSVNRITGLIEVAESYLSPIIRCLDEGIDEGEPSEEALSALADGESAFAASIARYIEETKSDG
jgi:hypothetical protein